MSEASAGLRLMLGLIEDHELFGSEPGSAPAVFPVVHDGFERDQQLLEAAFRRAGGELFTISPDQTEQDGEPAANLLGVIEATIAGEDGIEVSIEAAGGKVKATSTPGLEKSPANNLLLATLVRVLSSELARHPLVGIAYDAVPLDNLRRRLLWQMLVHQVPSALPRSIGTFVPLMAGELDYQRHCSGEPSVRYAVVEGSFRKRGLDQSNMAARIAEVVPDLERPLVIFLGAGASASAKIPVGDAVRNDAIERLVGDLHGRTHAEAFRRWTIEHQRLLSGESDLTIDQFATRLTLERVLREEFKSNEELGVARENSETVRQLRVSCNSALDMEPPGRKALRALIAGHPRSIFATVNFDRQVEDGLETPCRVFSATADFEEAAGLIDKRMRGEAELAPILKVHGSIESPETLVANLDDTEMGLPDPVKAALEQIFSTAADMGQLPVRWLWVGCSMRDIDISRWMRVKDCGEIYDLWVDPLPGPTIEDFAREYRSDIDLTQRQVSELPDVFLPALAAHVEELGA